MVNTVKLNSNRNLSKIIIIKHQSTTKQNNLLSSFFSLFLPQKQRGLFHRKNIEKYIYFLTAKVEWSYDNLKIVLSYYTQAKYKKDKINIC